MLRVEKKSQIVVEISMETCNRIKALIVASFSRKCYRVRSGIIIWLNEYEYCYVNRGIDQVFLCAVLPWSLNTPEGAAAATVAVLDLQCGSSALIREVATIAAAVDVLFACKSVYVFD